jgi:hypothetical protein
MAARPIDARSDFVYENDVALGRLLDFLATHEDPRRDGHKLIDNTIVIFTSDNGAERDSEISTGPFRSHKGSTYEGGHRVPFLVAWKSGGVGDGDPSTSGASNDSLIGLQDMFATFCDVLGCNLPDLRTGAKGGEDSASVLAAWRGNTLPNRPMFFSDHKQADDPAAVAFRTDDPVVNGQAVSGKWKILLDASLVRAGQAQPVELYDLGSDPREQENRINEPALQELVDHLASQALLHRSCGGHRIAEFTSGKRHHFDWIGDTALRNQFDGKSTAGVTIKSDGVAIHVSARRDAKPLADQTFHINPRGLGIDGQQFRQVDGGEELAIRFDTDVIVESVAVVAGNGRCGGFYRVADHAPLAIYCVDADMDSKDQSGILSDIGVVKAGQVLRLSSSPHFGVEAPGQWRIGSLTVRSIQPNR